MSTSGAHGWVRGEPSTPRAAVSTFPPAGAGLFRSVSPYGSEAAGLHSVPTASSTGARVLRLACNFFGRKGSHGKWDDVETRDGRSATCADENRLRLRTPAMSACVLEARKGGGGGGGGGELLKTPTLSAMRLVRSFARVASLLSRRCRSSRTSASVVVIAQICEFRAQSEPRWSATHVHLGRARMGPRRAHRVRVGGWHVNTHFWPTVAQVGNGEVTLRAVNNFSGAKRKG